MTKTPLGSEKSGNDQNPTSLMTETRKINDTVTPKGAKSIVQKYRIVSSAKTRIRLENEADLVKLVAEIMAVYMTHDKGHNKSSCNLWNSWSSKGFTDPDNDVHKLATIIDYPKNRHRSVKGIGKHMIELIPILGRYLSFSKPSKDTKLICLIRKQSWYRLLTMK